MAFVWVIAGFAAALWWVLKYANWSWPARLRFALANASAPLDPDERIVDCAHCGQRNRLRKPTGTPRFRCGKCHKSLPNPFPPPPPITAEPGAWFRPAALSETYGGTVTFRELPPEQRSVSTQDLADVVDAFTGEKLKASLGIFQCFKCQVFYHRASYETLQAENGGQCVACLSVSIRVLSVVVPRPGFRPVTGQVKPEKENPGGEATEPVTLISYREQVGEVVTFEGFVPRVLMSSSGHNFALMFQDREWSKGFKAVIMGRDVPAVGGEPFLRNLAGRTIRIHGVIQKHPESGYEIVLTDRSMIKDIR